MTDPITPENRAVLERVLDKNTFGWMKREGFLDTLNRLMQAVREESYKKGWSDREDDILERADRMGLPAPPVQGDVREAAKIVALHADFIERTVRQFSSAAGSFIPLSDDEVKHAAAARESQRLAHAIRTILSAIRPETQGEPVAAQTVEEFVTDYEFRGEADYKPKPHEQEMLIDALHGYLATARPAPPIPAEVDEASEIERLERLVYVPGVLKCAKCGFRLIKTTLSASDGRVAANNTPDHCPNDGSPMWRVTERDAGNKMIARADELSDRAIDAEAQRDTLQADVVRLREAWDWLGQNTNLELTFEYPEMDEPGRWEVNLEHGGYNDREWDLIATGETPLEAIQCARAALNQKEG